MKSKKTASSAKKKWLSDTYVYHRGYSHTSNACKLRVHSKCFKCEDILITNKTLKIKHF